ncbi:MAG: tetratricopeptide repeat protein, partial [Candidatus Brocadiae bacterium]|nr:tetratricopeptide repeat protein [Candidatus Brocadiia bacterium]
MPTQPSERRTVAVAFAQVLGPAPDDTLLTSLRVCVERHGGMVDKFIGDVVMAVFGAPIARGDDTARGLRAALAMRGVARAAGRDLRAGLNRGEVFWSAVGGDRATAIGDAVNVAQRLQAAAEPGVILASASAWEAAGEGFEGRCRGALQLKGRSEAVEAWEIEVLPVGVTRRSRAAAGVTPFLGREDVLGGLVARFEGGAGGLVVVRGAPGAGKSRMLAEFRRLARIRHPGTWVETGRAVETAALPRDVFSGLVGDAALGGMGGGSEGVARAVAEDLRTAGATDVERRTWADLVALSLGRAAPDAAVREMDPLRLRAETAHAWSRWIRARAAGKPALLCLEDLQWADTGSRELLSDLVEILAGVPVLFAGAARPEAPSFGGDVVELDDLSREVAREVASAVLGAPIGDALAAFLAARAGGNPLYIEELCRYLRDRRLVHGAPLALATESTGVPHALQDLLVAQADQLSAPAKETLKAAGVIGTAFWSGLLGRLLGRGVDGDLGEARSRALVAMHEGSLLPEDREFGFRHALIRDALVSLLPRKDRARLHASIAADLSGPSRSGRIDLLTLAAQHAEAGGNPPAAAELWMRVHARTERVSTIEQSLRAAKEAVRLGFGPRAVAAEAEALIRLGRAGEALDRLRQAGDGLEGLDGMKISLARSSACFEAGRIPEALAEASRARALARDAGDRVRCLRAEARALEAMGRTAEAEDRVREGLAEADSGRLPEGPELDLSRSALHNLASVLSWGQGRTEEGIHLNERALLLARRAGSREQSAGALHNRCVHLRIAGRFEEALAAMQEGLELRREIGDRSGIALSLNSQAACLSDMGRFEEGLACAREAVSIAREARTPEPLARALLNAAFLQARLGRLGESLEAVTEAVALRRSMGAVRTLVFALINLGHIRLQRAEPQEAFAPLLEAERLVREKLPRALADVAYNLAWAKLETGDNAGALQLAEEGRIEAERRPETAIASFLADLLSRLRSRRGEHTEAVRLAERSLQWRKGGGSEGRSLVVLAEARLAAGDAAGSESAAAAAVALAV